MADTMEDDETPLMASSDTRSPFTNSQEQSRRQRGALHVIRPCFAEFIGVTIFVFLGTISGTSEGIVSVAMAHGLTIMLLVIAFGDLSGGHFNPCVTLGAMIGGGISPPRSFFYILSQLLGSILGAALTKGVLPEEVYKHIHCGIPDLSADISVWQGILCEATLTFPLVLTVLMTAVDRADNILAPVAIGLVVTVDIAAAGGISGAVMNPARAFGPAVVGASVFHSEAFTHQYVYWAGPAAGSLLAAAFYRLILASGNKRFICKQC